MENESEKPIDNRTDRCLNEEKYRNAHEAISADMENDLVDGQ